MEKSVISTMNYEYLINLGLKEGQIPFIESLIQRAISEKLYTNTKDFYHDLKHIERVITYVLLIINEKEKNKEIIENKNLLILSALYHDIGRTIGSSNQEHGIIGAQEVTKYLETTLSPQEIDVIKRLIITHAQEEDEVRLDDTSYTEEEKKNIQLLSDILKDADALDRNRLNYPPPLGTCDINKLRTQEAKKLFSKTADFLFQYMTAIIHTKEKEKNQSILNNYSLLDEWINQYLEHKKMGQEEKGFMFHASLDPSIEILEPQESTQKGSYVYGGVDPIDCFTMASFRMSSLFARSRDKETNQRIIIEVFPETIKKTLTGKYITLYRLPEYEFQEYKREVTSSPRREWVSENAVQPIEEVTFLALELLEYLKSKGLLNIVGNISKRQQLRQVLPGAIRIWDLKHQKNNPNYRAKKDAMADYIWTYYAPEFLPAIKDARRYIDEEIEKYNQKYYETHREYPDYSSEDETHLKVLQDRIIPKIQSKEYIDYLCNRFSIQNEEQQQLLEQKNQLLNQGPKL